jgi:cell division protein FtsL
MTDDAAQAGARDDTPRVVWGAKAFALTFLWVGALTALGVYHVRNRHEVHRLGVELSTETLRYRSRYEENRKLRLELSSVKHADRVRDQAEKHLGMRVPAPQDLIEIR